MEPFVCVWASALARALVQLMVPESWFTPSNSADFEIPVYILNFWKTELSLCLELEINLWSLTLGVLKCLIYVVGMLAILCVYMCSLMLTFPVRFVCIVMCTYLCVLVILA